MNDHPLLPSRELAAAVLSPLRVVITAVIAMTVPLLLLWAICITLYYTTWHQSSDALVALFEKTVRSTQSGEVFSHVDALSVHITTWLHEVLFVRSGLQSSLMQDSTAAPSTLGHSLRSLSSVVQPSFKVVMLSTQVFGVRVALLVGMAPLLILGYVLAYSDGCAERAIRRACAGRESASLYHRAKHFQFGLVGALLLCTLCLPFHITPTWLLLGSSLALSLLARLQWTYYKKYL